MPLPAIIPPLIAAGATIGSSIAEVLGTNAAQKRSIKAQRSLQSVLLNQGAHQAQVAKQAGLSPAFNIGNAQVPVASTPASPSPHFDASGFLDSINGINLRELQAQQTKRESAATKVEEANAQFAQTKADDAKLDYQIKLAGLDATKKVTFHDPDTGRQLTKEEVENWNSAEHNGSTPELRTDLFNLQKEKSRGEESELRTQEIERGGRQREVQTQDVERNARQSSARVQDAVNRTRISNQAIIRCMAQMPEKEYELLERQVEKYGAEIAFQNLYNKQFEESSAGRLIESLKGPGTFGDKFLRVLTWLANNIRLSASVHN